MTPTQIEQTVERPAAAAKQGTTATAWIIGMGTVLRLLVVWNVAAKYPHDWLYTRGMEMGLLAKSLLAGRGLASPFGPETGPTAFIAPGYPVLVAGIFRVFGTYSYASAIAVMLLQAGCAAVTIWLVMHVARQLGGRAASIAAGVVWAVGLPLLWVPTIFWDTSLALALLAGMTALVLHLRARPMRGQWLLLGACCAMTGLVNPALLPSVGAMTLWLMWQVRRDLWRNAAMTALAFVLLFAPWPVRNAKVFHAFIPLRTTVGFELWMGNRPGASGFLDEDQFPSFNQRELARYERLGEVAYTREKTQMAEDFIVRNPGVFVRMTALRAIRFWTGTGSKGGSPVFALYATLTSMMGLGGLAMMFRRERALAMLFALPCALFPVPYYITHAEFRYRLVLDPLLTMLAGYALAQMRARWATAKQEECAAGEALEASHA